MAIKLKDVAAVVQKRFASGARTMSPSQMKTGKTTQLWSKVKRSWLLLLAYGESSRSR